MDNIFNKEKKETEMDQVDAFKKIGEIAKKMDSRLFGDDLEELKKELWKVVAQNNLIFNENDESFTFKLRNPISEEDGTVVHNIIKIEDCSMTAKKGITKHKEGIDQRIALFSAYCKEVEGKDIAHGFLGRIKTKDQIIINAVIQGFFLEAVQE